MGNVIKMCIKYELTVWLLGFMQFQQNHIDNLKSTLPEIDQISKSALNTEILFNGIHPMSSQDIIYFYVAIKE